MNRRSLHIAGCIFLALGLAACNSVKDTQSQAAADACRYLKSQSFNQYQKCAFGKLDAGNYAYNKYELQLRALAQYLGEQERLKRITTAEAVAQWDYQKAAMEIAIEHQQAAAISQVGARMQAASAALAAASNPPSTNVYVNPAPKTCYRNGNYINCY